MTDSTTRAAAIVTGASRGLGRGAAAAIAATGRPVILVGRDLEALERASSEIAGETSAARVDVTDESAVIRLVADARDRFGTIDCLVNAAGAPPVIRPPHELTWEAFRTPIEVDVRGVFNLVRAAGPLMGAGATVVSFSSGAVVAASPMHVSFSPGQAALLSLSRCLGAWLGPQGVVTHCVAPSLTLAGEVGRTAAAAFGAPAGLSGEQWIHRRFGEAMLTPEQTGEAVVALLGVRQDGDWVLTPSGLHPWSPLAAPDESGWGTGIRTADVAAGA